MERRGTRWQHKKAGGRFKGVSSKEERERERGHTERYKAAGGRGADKKNEEATRSVEGMPSDERRRAAVRARLLSRFQKALPPWPSLPSRYTRENTLSLSPPVSNLPLPSSAAAAFFSSRHTVVVVVDRSPSLAPLQTDGHMRAIVVVADTSRGLTCHTRSAARLTRSS